MPPLFGLLIVNRLGLLGRPARAPVQKMLDAHLDWLESELASRDWFAGDAFTAADIMMSFPLEAACHRAGLDQRRLHGLRRVFTTLLDAAGVSERVTMKAAGHKTPAMTRYYQDPMESQLAEAAERLDGQLRRVLSGG
jgi:glutathione S-transferase